MKRQIILGMGAGQCGTRLLANILGKQPNTRMTHEDPPLLSWTPTAGMGGIRERLQRILDTRKERFVGDVASFYLPYVEEAIRFDPGVRIICLKRPREEVVEGFCRFLDRSSRYLINHWTCEPQNGWYHDPIWTRIFPQYETQDREEGIRKYWEEYYRTAEDLARRFPENVRIWDTQILTAEQGVREVLSFAGVPHGDQVTLTGQRSSPADAGPGRSLLRRTRGLCIPWTRGSVSSLSPSAAISTRSARTR